MWRRWIIRSFFLGLLLLCVGGWAVSYGYFGYVRRSVSFVAAESPGAMTLRFVAVRMEVGSLRFFWVQLTSPKQVGDHPEVRWESWVKPLSGGYGSNRELWDFWVHLDRTHHGTYNFDALKIPLWFPTLCLSLACVFIWRKTARPKPGGAFPVAVPQQGRTPATFDMDQGAHGSP